MLIISIDRTLMIDENRLLCKSYMKWAYVLQSTRQYGERERILCFNAGSQKGHYCCDFFFFLPSPNALDLTRSYFLLWRYSLVSVWELLATDSAAGVISVILSFVSLLIDRPRVLRFWNQSINCTLWICLRNWQASTTVKSQRCRWTSLTFQVLTGECTTVTVYSAIWNRMVWFIGTNVAEETPTYPVFCVEELSVWNYR